MLCRIALLSNHGLIIGVVDVFAPRASDETSTRHIDDNCDFADKFIFEADRSAFRNALLSTRASGAVESEFRNIAGELMRFEFEWLNPIQAYTVCVRMAFEEYRPLTERQSRVLQLLCADHTLGQIAELLDIKVTTVQTYASRLRERAQVTTNHGLAIWALKTGNATFSSEKNGK